MKIIMDTNKVVYILYLDGQWGPFVTLHIPFVRMDVKITLKWGSCENIHIKSETSHVTSEHKNYENMDNLQWFETLIIDFGS